MRYPLLIMSFLLIVLLFSLYKLARLTRAARKRYSVWRNTEYDELGPIQLDTEEYGSEW